MRIAELVADPTGGTVVEIGAGLGALTIPLAKTAASVYAVEKDQRLYELLKAELLVKKVSNVTLIPEDILQVDYQPFFDEYGRQLLVCGNLPYNISSQIIIQLIRSRAYVNRAILMFQKELAQRLIAQPGTKDYGRLAVMLRYCANVKSIATINASVFFPPPKVASEILELWRKKGSVYLDGDTAMQIRKNIHVIFENLSIIGGFCDGGSRDYIDRLSNIVGNIVMRSQITMLDVMLLELFFQKVNTIMVDWTKTPFKFSGEFKAKLREFEAKVKAALSRK